MDSSAISLAIDSRGVATLTLSRPEKHNAFDDVIIGQLIDALDRVAADEDVRVLVLAAEGKSFSAGADLAWMQRMANYSEAQNCEDARALAAMLKRLNTLPQPTIAKVQGAAYGGAVGLVSCCDMAIGTERARFCLSEVKIGLIPATISPYVINAIGPRAARRYFTTAEVIDAEQALKLGLLSETVEAEALEPAVERLLLTLLENGPSALRAAKALVIDYAQQPISDALIEDSCKRIASIRVSSEGQEGLQAFLEKRPPAWRQSDV